MKAKILSVLLVVLMLVALVPMATISASADGYDYTYYVSATGDDSANTGLTPDSPLKNVGAAYKKFVAANPAADKTAVVYVMGATASTTTTPGNGFLSTNFADKFVPNVFVVEGYKGAGYESTEAVLYFPVSSVGHGSTRKTVTPGNYHFKNLTIVPDLAESAETGVTELNVYFSAGEGDLTLDNVTFPQKEYTNSAIAVNWTINVDSTSPTSYANHYEVKALQSASDHIDHDPTLTFLNGNYEHISVNGAGQIAAVSGSNNIKDFASSGTAGVLKGASRVGAKVSASYNSLQPTYSAGLNVVIGAGAKMGTVSAFNWNYVYSHVNVTVKAGAEVKNLYGAGPSALNFNFGSYTMPVTIIVEDGATVTKALCYADTVDYAEYKNAEGAAATAIDPAKITRAEITLKMGGKTFVNGVEAGATTADSSSVVFFSVLAILSLAGVVVLKKQSVR